MKNKVKEKVDKVYEYLIDEDRYRDTLELLIKKKEYDLAIIILWKIFIYFIYQRLNEIDRVKIITEWNKKNKKALESEVNLDNFFWANEKQDSEIITFLGVLYPVDKNLVKTIRGMLDIRNICAHVSDTFMNEDNLLSYMSNLISNMKALEEKHLKDDSIKLERLINELKISKSFAKSEYIQNQILQLERSIKTVHLKDILSASLRNDQVYDAWATEEFLLKIYKLTHNGNRDIWEKFSGFIDQYLNNEYFTNLKKKILNDFLPF